MANYRITDEDNLIAGGAKTKAKQSIAAIRLLKEIEAQPRAATAEEQAVLIRYSGWGAAPDIFTTKDSWAKLQGELKELLSDDEFNSARSSTLNAHYTAPTVVSEIYAGLERLGFDGGRVLDPSMGASGMFEGLMPEAMAQASDMTGIELDSISGRIAAQLYPESTIHVSGFQDVALPDDHFDLSISNVPFSEIGVADPEYNGLPVNTLHDYFFAKGLDKVKPGGLVAYITSTGTMQSARGGKFRQHMADRANLVGAIRLPGDAFKQMAGTEVTTDIVILQKLGNEVEPDGKSWVNLLPTSVVDEEGTPLKTNEYFVNNPQMMLGTLANDKLHPGRLAMRSDGRAIDKAIREAFEQMPEGIYQPASDIEPEEARRLVPPELQKSLKEHAFTLHEDQLMIRQGAWLEPVDLTGKKLERAIGLISIRDTTEHVLNVQLQNGSERQVDSAQADLNRIYDRFVKANGPISRQANKLVFKKDPSFPLLLALEKYDRESRTATKTDIFSKRTIQPYVAKTSAETAQEGLLYSLNEFGKVDIGHIAQLVGIPEAEAVAELQQDDFIFLDPASDQWQTRDEYLSGNVKRKLDEAVSAAKEDPTLSRNVDALKAVQPNLIPPGDIDVRLGATWIPTNDVETFVSELLEAEKEDINIHHSKGTDKWYVKADHSTTYSASNTKIYGAPRNTALELIETALNLKTPIIYDYDKDRNRTLNVEETAAAKLKFEEIRERFKQWLWVDPKRTDRLTTLYNDKFNTHTERQFSGDHLELPGKNTQITLRPHQKNAIWRSLSGNTLFAHAVGAGKTFTMISSAMEQKRLGLAKKPMIVVPNHLLEQISADCKYLYPGSNVLAATKQDSSKKNRQHLMSRIATGDWDIVLVTHSAFEKLRLSDEMQTAFYQEAVDEIEEAIKGAADYNGDSRRVMKDLERRKESLKNKISEIADNPAKDNTVTFEQLGVDALIVDESHYFKNLGYTTKMQNVAGLPNTNSNRAFDMFMKVRYISEVRGEGKGVCFATGTPVTNSMAELYTLQRYLQPEVLKNADVSSFDDWASIFGDTVTTPELSTTGEFKIKTRFSRFTNLPELMTLCRQSMDVQTADMLNLPVPQIAGGKPTIIAVPATDEQLLYMEDLVERSKNMSSVDPTEDNMLKITGDGRKMSATIKLIDPTIPHDPDGKLSRLVNDTVAYYQTHQEEKTHLIFCDLGTPKTTGKFSIYQYVKEEAIKRGVPAEKIAFAQDANTDAQKLTLQKNFNSGKVAILIAGASLETGFNGQRRLGRISHYTVPWRPDQIEQRDGRGLRQGNRNKEIELFRYTTQGRNGQIGIDGYLWQTLKTKQKFVDQVMRGSTTLRRMDDISNDALSYSELEGISTGNPLIMEKATVDNDVAQLTSQKRAHTNSLYRKRQSLNVLPQQIRSVEQSIKAYTNDLAVAKAAIQSGTVTLFGADLPLDDAEEVGKLIRSRAAVLNKVDEAVKEPIGKLGSLNLYLQTTAYSVELVIEGAGRHRRDNILQSKIGAYEALSDIPHYLEKAISSSSRYLERTRKDLETLSKDTDAPFSKEAELGAALKRQAEIYAALDSIGKEPKTTVKVAEAEDQPNALTRRVARFLEHTDLRKEVMSSDGFKVTLTEVDTQTPVAIDATEGKLITIQASVPISTLGAAQDITVTFNVSDKGILEEVEASDTDQVRSNESTQLGLYLAKSVFSLSAQNVDEAQEPEETNSQESVNEVTQSASEDAEVREATAAASSTNVHEPTEAVVEADSDSNEGEHQETQPVVSLPLDESSTTSENKLVSSPEIIRGAGKEDPEISNVKDQTGDTRANEEAVSQSDLPVASQATPPSTGKEEESLPKTTESKPNEKNVGKQTEADKNSDRTPQKSYVGEAVTVSRNPEQQGIEIRFTGKPEKEWTAKLKSQKFRFSNRDRDPRWYKKETNASIRAANQFAMEYEAAVCLNPQWAIKEPMAPATDQASAEQKSEVTVYPQIEKAIEVEAAGLTTNGGSEPVNQRIQPPFEQAKKLERAVATFLTDAGLSKIVMSETLCMTVENEKTRPLWLDVHTVEGERSLTIEQHGEYGEKAAPITSSVSFSISKEGTLKLQSTAFQSHFATNDAKIIEGRDRSFAESFIQTITRQQFSQATFNQLQTAGPESGRDQYSRIEPIPETVHQPMSEQIELAKPEEGPTDVGSISSPEAVPRVILASQLIQKAVVKHDPELADALTNNETVEVKIEQLREWYIAAREQQKAPDVLGAIKEKGMAAKKSGVTTLGEAEADAMSADIRWLAERQEQSETKKVSVETLREWYAANILTAGSNYTDRIKEIATPIQRDGLAEIPLGREDYQRMSSDIKALRSTLAEQTSTIWKALESLNMPTQAPDGGRSYIGKEHTISESPDRDTLELVNTKTKRGLKLEEGQVLLNTLSLADAKKIKDIAAEIQHPNQRKEPQR